MDAAVRMHIAAMPADLDALAAALRGEIVRPSDEAYADVSRIWNQAHQGTPMAVVCVADAGDVATAVDFARSNGIEIAVRAGGHSVAGHGSAPFGHPRARAAASGGHCPGHRPAAGGERPARRRTLPVAAQRRVAALGARRALAAHPRSLTMNDGVSR